jgi:hypothetical protein
MRIDRDLPARKVLIFIFPGAPFWLKSMTSLPLLGSREKNELELLEPRTTSGEEFGSPGRVERSVRSSKRQQVVRSPVA